MRSKTHERFVFDGKTLKQHLADSRAPTSVHEPRNTAKIAVRCAAQTDRQAAKQPVFGHPETWPIPAPQLGQLAPWNARTRQEMGEASFRKKQLWPITTAGLTAGGPVHLLKQPVIAPAPTAACQGPLIAKVKPPHDTMLRVPPVSTARGVSPVKIVDAELLTFMATGGHLQLPSCPYPAMRGSPATLAH